MKHAMLHQIDEALPTEVIVGSSTSSFLLLDMIQECSRAPERFVLSHPFNRAPAASPPPQRPCLGSGCLSDHAYPVSASPHAACRAVWHGRRLRGQGNRLLPLGGSPSDHDEQAVAGPRRESPDLRHLSRGGLDAQGGHREPSSPLPQLALRTPAALSAQASVADIDAAMSQGPGMRFAHMGPFQTYHLAAGDGGIAQYLEHLGPSQVRPSRVQLSAYVHPCAHLHGVCGARRPGGRALERALCWSRG